MSDVEQAFRRQNALAIEHFVLVMQTRAAECRLCGWPLAADEINEAAIGLKATVALVLDPPPPEAGT